MYMLTPETHEHFVVKRDQRDIYNVYIHQVFPSFGGRGFAQRVGQHQA